MNPVLFVPLAVLIYLVLGIPVAALTTHLTNDDDYAFWVAATIFWPIALFMIAVAMLVSLPRRALTRVRGPR